MHRVKQYAAAMTAGVWKLNGETIKFNCNGQLIDGQHRLNAIVLAGKTVQTYVLYGLPADAFDTIDGGKPRSNGDRLARRNEKHYQLVAAVAARVWNWEQGDRIGKGSPRVDVMDDILKRHSVIRDVVHDVAVIRPQVLPGSDSGFLMYAGRSLWGDRSDVFWNQVLSAEGLVKGTPGHTLYRRLSTAQASTLKMSQQFKLAISIKAFNAAMKNKRIKHLSWGESESFPEFAEQSAARGGK